MFIISKEEFIQVKAAWASRSHHTASQHIVYNLLRGKDPKLGFAEKTKNIQGNDPWYGFNAHKRHAWCLSRKEYQGSDKIFKQIFGIDLPDGLAEIVKNA